MTRILVVDDAPDMRVLCREALGRLGHEVVTVRDGEEALSFLELAPDLPDLVLLDVQMPGLDGWEVLERIRAHPRTAELRVVMFTVRSRREDRVRAWSRGCDGYVSKPFDLPRFVADVEEVLARADGDRVARRESELVILGGCEQGDDPGS
jgi:CheY-like chemotaxis protein